MELNSWSQSDLSKMRIKQTKVIQYEYICQALIIKSKFI